MLINLMYTKFFFLISKKILIFINNFYLLNQEESEESEYSDNEYFPKVQLIPKRS